jgi:peptidyl-prolyl cis-trans isomerase SurA
MEPLPSNPRALRSRLRVVAATALVVGAGVLAARPADAAIVERIVAVVGERPILLSELRQRARPHLFRIAVTMQNPTQQAAAESEMFRELLTRLVDERLEEQAADKAHLTVTPDEVDNAIRTVAAQARMDPKQLVAEAKKQGLSEQDYRDEIRRQVLEGKLIQLRVRNRVRVTEQDARASYARWAKDAAQQGNADARVLILQIPPGSTQQTVAARMALGEELSRRGKAGEDFCEIIREFSDDPATRNACGQLPLRALLPDMQQTASTLKPGDVSTPLTVRDPTGAQAIVVMQLSPTSTPTKLPTYEEVKDRMVDLAFEEATMRQRKLWLQELRRGIYIDVRL